MVVAPIVRVSGLVLIVWVERLRPAALLWYQGIVSFSEISLWARGVIEKCANIRRVLFVVATS